MCLCAPVHTSFRLALSAWHFPHYLQHNIALGNTVSLWLWVRPLFHSFQWLSYSSDSLLNWLKWDFVKVSNFSFFFNFFFFFSFFFKFELAKRHSQCHKTCQSFVFVGWKNKTTFVLVLSAQPRCAEQTHTHTQTHSHTHTVVCLWEPWPIVAHLLTEAKVLVTFPTSLPAESLFGRGWSSLYYMLLKFTASYMHGHICSCIIFLPPFQKENSSSLFLCHPFVVPAFCNV